MIELPGWNSIQTTGMLSNLFFWISIGALLLLGAAEVASHRYGEQHDRLVSQRQESEKQVTDKEIARLHLESAGANERAAEANKKAAEAAFALEKFRAPRSLSAEQVSSIIHRLKPFSGQQFQIVTYWDLKEPMAFANLLYVPLTQAGWIYKPLEVATMMLGGNEGVEVWVHPAADVKVREAATSLVSALNAVGVEAKLKEQNPKNPKDNKLNLNIGTKP